MDLETTGSPWDQAEVPDDAGRPEPSADPNGRWATATAGIEEGGEISSTLSQLVREPQQERSRKTLQRIVDASHALLETGGTDALTVGGIAKRARTSVGSFYARFDGKDELSRYLGEFALGEVIAAWEEGLAGLDLPDEVAGEEQAVSWEEIPPLLVALFSEPAARHLVLLDGIEDPAPTRGDRLESRLLQDLLDLLEYPARPALHSLVVARTTLATASALAGPGAEEGEPEDVARELGCLLDAYLRGAPVTRPDAAEPEPEPPTEPDDEADVADPFDVWA